MSICTHTPQERAKHVPCHLCRIEHLRGELSLAEEGLANYAQENGQLRSALKGLSDMYARTWDRVDGALVMMPDRVSLFEEVHRAARIALGEQLDGEEIPSEPQSVTTTGEKP